MKTKTPKTPKPPAKDPDCKGCQHTGMYPSHNGSRNCESGSIASGGTKSHCTCNACF